MNKLRFSGLAAALVLLAGCAIPVGYPGYYGGYGGYEAYTGTYANPYGYAPYSSVLGAPYGYYSTSPYYGYDSSAPVIVNNQIPVPVYPNNGTVTDPYASSGNWYSSRYRRQCPYNRNHQSTTPPSPGTVTPGGDTGDSPVTDPSAVTAGQAGRFNRWQSGSSRWGSDPTLGAATPGSGTGSGTSGISPNRLTQSPQNWQRPQTGTPMLPGRSPNYAGNPSIPAPNNLRTFTGAPSQSPLASQPRLGASQYSRGPMSPPAMSGSIMRAPGGAGLTAPRTGGATVMRAPQGQPAANQQKRVIPGMQ